MLAYFQLMRPHQWIKNIVIFVPSLLSGIFVSYLTETIIAFIAFSMASSAAYIINDIFDAPSDRLHPIKRLRPIASYKASTNISLAISALLAFASIAIVSIDIAILITIYLAINIAYSAKLKHIPIIDGVSISMGFILRLLVGGPAIGIAMNPWIFSSFFFAAMGMAMVKRRVELISAGKSTPARSSLRSMNRSLLDVLVSIFMAAALSLYAAWTALHQQPAMIFSLPILSIAFARLMWLAYASGDGEDFSKTLLTDIWMIISGVFWLGTLFIFS